MAAWSVSQSVVVGIRVPRGCPSLICGWSGSARDAGRIAKVESLFCKLLEDPTVTTWQTERKRERARAKPTTTIIITPPSREQPSPHDCSMAMAATASTSASGSSEQPNTSLYIKNLNTKVKKPGKSCAHVCIHLATLANSYGVPVHPPTSPSLLRHQKCVASSTPSSRRTALSSA